MRFFTFYRILLSAILTICLGVSAVGCSRSQKSSEPLDAGSVSITEQSNDDTGAESAPIEVIIDPSSKYESIADEAESKADKPESSAEEPEIKAEESQTSADGTESTSKEQESSKIEESSKQSKKDEKTDGNIVIMLDPGHDDDCSPRNHPQLGLNEQDIDLKIGLACYERLSQYEGITPYLTRYDGSCPNADKMFDDGGNYDCIEKRAYLAEEKNADFFVSLHCNATTGELGAEANGISVFITNYPEFHDKCEKLGNMIIDHVTSAVDLDSFGLFSEYKEEKGYYKDGTVKDKLFLLSYNVDNDRPAIVVEHAFMDNTGDNAILKDDEKLKLIGQADADAIAEYYGLKLKQTL